MKRYLHLLTRELEKMNAAELSRKIDVPPPSIAAYVQFNREPRIKALEGMSRYFREPVSALLLDHEENNNDYLNLVELYRKIQHLSPVSIKGLLDIIRTNKE